MRRLAYWIYCALAAFALVLVPLGLLGLAETNAAAGVLLLFLGFPWSFILTNWIDSGVFLVNFALLAVALGINGLILRLLQRRRRPRPTDDETEAEEEEDAAEAG